MRRLWSLLLVAGLYAQPTQTAINNTFYTQTGVLYTGNVQISLSTPAGTSGGQPVLSNPVTYRINNGVPASVIKLVPNDTMSPAGTAYIFTYDNGSKQTCTIPTSSTPISLVGICSYNPPPTPTPTFPLAWLNVAGYANNNYCINVANGVATLTTVGCPGSGGGGGTLMTWNGIEMSWSSGAMTWH